MILYFSGTGNSEYVAKKIGDYLEDEVLNLFYRIKNKDYSKLISDRPWVIVAPTYAWQLPHIVRDWLLRAKLEGNKKIYFVLTCGEGIGDAGKYAEKLCDRINMQYMGISRIRMPENYIAMFDVPEKDEIIKIVKKAQAMIQVTAQIIEAEVYNDMARTGIRDKVLSSVVNKGFYRYAVSAKKFYAKDGCISCGKCEDICPCSNIKLKNGKPVWGKECTHCMACICHCPKEVIEYGKISEGKVRYKFPMKKSTNRQVEELYED